MEDTQYEVGRGSMVHGNDDYAAVGASEECGDPSGGVGAPDHDAVAFVNFAGVEFAGETVSGISDVAVGGADYTIAVGLGEGGFPAEAREIMKIVGDAGSLHLASVTQVDD